MPSSPQAGKRWAAVAAASLVAAAVLVLGIMDTSRSPNEDAQTRVDNTDGALDDSRVLRVAEEPAGEQGVRPELCLLNPPVGGKLPKGFEHSFMFPDREPDQHGNPIVTRRGQRVDLDTGWPYEIWLKEPRLELVLVLPGEFTMGSSATPEELARRYGGEAGEYQSEGPAHPVRITRPFYLGKYEITQAQWRGVMGSQPWEGKDYVRDAPDHPAVWVNWHKCWEFARKLNGEVRGDGIQGFVPGFRLPTEAEWEYACRAGSAAAFWFGDEGEELEDHAWFSRNAREVGQAYAHGVGQKKPNAWGLHDLHGNVAEWCRDWRREYTPDPQTDPSGPSQGTERVLRGGSYVWPCRGCRSAARFYSDASTPRLPATIGTRVALSVEKAGNPSVAAGAGLPQIFTMPLRDLDRYGNAVVTREGRRTDPKTGWPYEIWLSEPHMEFVLVPPGKFTMGTPFTPEEMARRYDGEASDYESECPAHLVRITKPFYLGKYEVTRMQWAHVMGSEPWVGGKYVRANPRHPAVYINWFEWWEFMQKLTRLAAEEAQLEARNELAPVFRLPTEAEWEYACRAGSTTAFCFGDDIDELDDYAWHKRNAWDAGQGYTHPVGRRRPNAFGLHGLLGNVGEWSRDWYGEYTPDPQTDPRGPAHGAKRVVRGGTFVWWPRSCRSSARRWDVPRAGYGFGIGARVALSLERAEVVAERLREPSGDPPPKMPKDATRFRGHWYQFFAEKLRWHDARKRCEEMGGYLVCVESREENDFLRTFAEGKNVWLGATDEAQEGVWRWVNGSEFTYADWLSSEPNNNRKSQHYVEMCWSRHDGKWIDMWVGDRDLTGFVCEWEPQRGSSVAADERQIGTAARTGALTGDTLPPSLTVTASERDQYGRAVVTRYARRFDPETGWPYEIWLKEPPMEFVLVPPGEFTMGCKLTPEEMIGRYLGTFEDYEHENPAHQVRITKPFYLGKYEVTQSQWTRAMGSQPWKGARGVREDPLLPAVCINWFDWWDFVKKLTSLAADEDHLKAGIGLAAVFRLPTEAEWEYACRAGSTTDFYFGDNAAKLKYYGWYFQNALTARQGYGHPVGSRRPSRWGFYDMHGNVMEWCRDWFAEYPSDPQTDPRCPVHGCKRVIRGGGFGSLDRTCRSGTRREAFPRGVWYIGSVGARVALSLERAEVVAKRMREPSGDPPAKMPKDATRFRGHWYKFIAGNVPWHAAKKRCEEVGGYLVCVETREENDFLAGLVKGKSVWLGATDEEREGVWRWVNGSEFTYASWFPGPPSQPNNTYGKEHWLEISQTHDGKWLDVLAVVKQLDGFVCEWEPRVANDE